MNLLEELAIEARKTLDAGYYRGAGGPKAAASLVEAIARARAAGRRAIIAAHKPATPLGGRLASKPPAETIHSFVTQGACGLSVLTEPRRFGGSLANLQAAVDSGLPVIMKDFILDPQQIECAARMGASAVLLIAALHPADRLAALVDNAHRRGREVLLEVADPDEYAWAMDSRADLVGINNRDLVTFEVDVGRTVAIASTAPKTKPIVSMSGLRGPDDLERVSGVADAYLVGSSLLDGTTTLQELMRT